MADTSPSDQQLKHKAALLASRPGVVDHVRRTGRLPAEIPMGGAHIGARLLIEQRGWEIELREDEHLVYDALVRDRKSESQDEVVQSSAERGTDASSHDLIYGNAPNGHLVFMERSKALENIAFRAAITWGDFRKGAPTLYECALSSLDDGENRPPDTLELDHDALDGDGDLHYFPEQLMLDFIPQSVQRWFGKVEESAFNGAMLILDPNHESEIVALLRDNGFSVQRDDALMEALYI